MPDHPSASTESRVAVAEEAFGSVLVGIDETPESLVAAAQAAALRAPGDRLVLLGVAERYLAVHAGLAAADAEDRLFKDVSADLARARALVDADDTMLVPGRLVDVLCAECSRRGATLVAVGAGRQRRLTALTFGGHGIEALHGVPCSVLIARPGWGPHKPGRVVAAVDGSPPGRRAEAVGRTLAARLGCDVVPVVALGEPLDETVLRAERDDALIYPGRLTDAVSSAAGEASLIVVSRGQRAGHRSARTFVERLVYSAGCSVLVLDGGLSTGPAEGS
jgi:nucleotide-binding universal stress UspA family protein